MSCTQVDAGVKGVSPGAHTEEFLASLQRLMRVWAGLAVAGLAVAAHLFDAACARHLGFSLNSIMLIMITGYVTTALRQARLDYPAFWLCCVALDAILGNHVAGACTDMEGGKEEG